MLRWRFWVLPAPSAEPQSTPLRPSSRERRLDLAQQAGGCLKARAVVGSGVVESAGRAMRLEIQIFQTGTGRLAGPRMLMKPPAPLSRLAVSRSQFVGFARDMRASAPHSALMLAVRITLPHFSVCSTTILSSSAGEPVNAVAHRDFGARRTVERCQERPLATAINVGLTPSAYSQP